MKDITKELGDFLTVALRPPKQATRHLPANDYWNAALAGLTIPTKQEGRAHVISSLLHTVASDELEQTVASEVGYVKPTIAEGMAIIAENSLKGVW